jgi:hypothetical protein
MAVSAAEPGCSRRPGHQDRTLKYGRPIQRESSRGGGDDGNGAGPAACRRAANGPEPGQRHPGGDGTLGIIVTVCAQLACLVNWFFSAVLPPEPGLP